MLLRRWIVAAAVAVGTVGGVVIAMPAAHAQSVSACVHLSVHVNGQGTTQDVCLPPAGLP